MSAKFEDLERGININQTPAAVIASCLAKSSSSHSSKSCAAEIPDKAEEPKKDVMAEFKNPISTETYHRDVETELKLDNVTSTPLQLRNDLENDVLNQCNESNDCWEGVFNESVKSRDEDDVTDTLSEISYLTSGESYQMQYNRQCYPNYPVFPNPNLNNAPYFHPHGNPYNNFPPGMNPNYVPVFYPPPPHPYPVFYPTQNPRFPPQRFQMPNYCVPPPMNPFVASNPVRPKRETSTIDLNDIEKTLISLTANKLNNKQEAKNTNCSVNLNVSKNTGDAFTLQKLLKISNKCDGFNNTSSKYDVASCVTNNIDVRNDFKGDEKYVDLKLDNTNDAIGKDENCCDSSRNIKENGCVGMNHEGESYSLHRDKEADVIVDTQNADVNKTDSESSFESALSQSIGLTEGAVVQISNIEVVEECDNVKGVDGNELKDEINDVEDGESPVKENGVEIEEDLSEEAGSTATLLDIAYINDYPMEVWRWGSPGSVLIILHQAGYALLTSQDKRDLLLQLATFKLKPISSTHDVIKHIEEFGTSGLEIGSTVRMEEMAADDEDKYLPMMPLAKLMVTLMQNFKKNELVKKKIPIREISTLIQKFEEM